MTKKNKSLYNSYLQAENYNELYQVYGKYSYNKRRAMDYCKDLQYEKNGYNPKIVSHNSFIFTYAFLYDSTDGQHLMYITPSYNHDFLVA